MKYISVNDAAKKWQLSVRSVRKYLEDGRVIGAHLSGKTWLIPENAYKPASKRQNIAEDRSLVMEMIKFIDASPINMFVVKNSSELLVKNGYRKISERDNFAFSKGDKVFLLRNNSALIAINIPDNFDENVGCNIIASHSDSPCFKVKPIGDGKSDVYNKINLEPYGGMICSTWLDRPLSIAGRVMVSNGDKIEIKLVNIDENILMIPNLCVHFNRDINSGYNYNFATDMQAFIGENLSGEPLKDLLIKYLGLKNETIKNYDLFAYCRDNGFIWGSNKEYVSSPRLDDQECVFTSLKAFLEVKDNKNINILYIADNEEVGSSSATGADGDFLDRVLFKVSSSLKLDYQNVLSNSFLISADNAHAVHPNNIGITDPNNKAYMNKGIVIKFNASNRYTSDSISSSIFQSICESSNVPYQFFTNRSDLRGGSTLGNILLNHVSLLSVDIGLPQLAMHSSFETAGCKDVSYAINAFKRFYASKIHISEENFYIE